MRGKIKIRRKRCICIHILCNLVYSIIIFQEEDTTNGHSNHGHTRGRGRRRPILYIPIYYHHFNVYVCIMLFSTINFCHCGFKTLCVGLIFVVLFFCITACSYVLH